LAKKGKPIKFDYHLDLFLTSQKSWMAIQEVKRRV
jgi:hypothetical protein